MADYLTSFSCLFDVGLAENAERAEQIRGELAAWLDRHEGAELGFEMEVDHATGPGALWIHADGDGEPEHVIRFVLLCAEGLDLTGRWGFTWALTCSRPRRDGFGGGAQVIDLGVCRSLTWIDCDDWLQRALDPACNTETGIVQPAAEGGETAMGDSGVRSEDQPNRPEPG